MSDLEQYYLDEEKRQEDAVWDFTSKHYSAYLDTISQASAFILEIYKQNPSKIEELHEWIKIDIGFNEKKKILAWLFVFCITSPWNNKPKQTFNYYLTEDGRVYHEFLPDMFTPIDIESLKSKNFNVDTKNIYYYAASVMVSTASRYGSPRECVDNWKKSIEMSYYGDTIENVHKGNVIMWIGFLSFIVGAFSLLIFITNNKHEDAYIMGIVFVICVIIFVICYKIDSKPKK